MDEKMMSPHSSAPILLVDDEPSWLRSLSLTLERSAGLRNLLTCPDPRQVMELLGNREVALVLLDLTMPHLSGEELLTLIGRDHPQIPVIILTGMNQIETAVRCMKLGAFDFFVKTTEEERLIAGVLRALKMRELENENRRLRRGVLREGLRHPEAFASMVTRNARMEDVFRYIEAVAPSSEPVLITGESGTGKELAARAVHDIGRPSGPFVALNVAGLDDQHFADTLFGHVRGAFTGADRPRPGMIEQAQGGTLFLDEIGDLSPSSQVKLLRLIQEREYHPLGSDRPKKAHVRIVAATHQDLDARQAQGGFRRDLFYRLCAHQVRLPRLKERPDDLLPLLDHFLEEASLQLKKQKPAYPAELGTLLINYEFPGNVRQLRSMVFDALSTHSGGTLSMAPFRRAMGPATDEAAAIPFGEPPPSPTTVIFPERLPTLEEAGRLLVREAMERTRGNQTQAARLLGITRPALAKRLRNKGESSDL